MQYVRVSTAEVRAAPSNRILDALMRQNMDADAETEEIEDSEEGDDVAYADYKMNNPKWKNNIYSVTGNKAQTMGKTGCGPTAAADVVASFCDKKITPWDVAQWFMKKGFRTRNNGTTYSAFKWIAKKYKNKGIKKFKAGRFSAKQLRAALEQGALVVCSMGPGYWTNGGHYIVAHKMDEAYVYALDPGSKTRKKQAIAPFMKQCKRMFIYWPEAGGV